MAKLSKAQAKQHAAACKVLEKDRLTWEDKYFVLENWQESANHVNGSAGAFFTPPGLAHDFAIDACGGSGRVIDLCAGIGGLAFAVNTRNGWNGEERGLERERDMVLVEINADYVEVGKKIMPEARWIHGNIFDLPADIGTFETAISNPPFGSVKHDGKAPRYTGSEFEYKAIDLAATIARYGCFIIPQTSSPFQFSGQRNYNDREPPQKYQKFAAQTGIELTAGCGIDTAYHRDAWHGVSPLCEVVLAEFQPIAAAEPAQQILRFW